MTSLETLPGKSATEDEGSSPGRRLYAASPHPSSSGLSQQRLIDVVPFCLSLSREPKKVLTDHQRAALATSRAYLQSLGHWHTE